jgi:hypothetical protein
VLGRAGTGWREGMTQAVSHLYPDLVQSGAAGGPMIGR